MSVLLAGKGRRKFFRFIFPCLCLAISVFCLWSVGSQYPPDFKEAMCEYISLVKPRRDSERPTISCSDGHTYLYKSVNPQDNLNELVNQSGMILFQKDLKARRIRKITTDNGTVYWGKTTFAPFDTSSWVYIAINALFTLFGIGSAWYFIYHTATEQRYRQLIAKALRIDQYDGPI